MGTFALAAKSLHQSLTRCWNKEVHEVVRARKCACTSRRENHTYMVSIILYWCVCVCITIEKETNGFVATVLGILDDSSHGAWLEFLDFLEHCITPISLLEKCPGENAVCIYSTVVTSSPANRVEVMPPREKSGVANYNSSQGGDSGFQKINLLRPIEYPSMRSSFRGKGLIKGLHARDMKFTIVAKMRNSNCRLFIVIFPATIGLDIDGAPFYNLVIILR